MNGGPLFLPVSGQRSRGPDSTERRPRRSVLNTASLPPPPPPPPRSLRDQQITMSALRFKVERKMAVNQRTTNGRLCRGKHVQAHARLHAAQTERDLVCVPTEKRGWETQNQAVRLSRYKRRGSWFFHEVDLSHIWSFATEAVEQSLPERMERWWFPTQMLHSLGLLDPIRGHISHQPRRDALSLLTTFLFFSHRVIWPQLIFICCLMSPRRSFPPLSGGS